MTSAAAPATAYDVVTAVWGAEFIELFLELCIPNQLSPGNLPALPHGSRYRIFTPRADVPLLSSHRGLDPVRQLLPVEIVEVDMTDADRAARPRERWNTHKRMIACHRKAAADAAVEGRALIFLAPDFILSEGTIAGLVRMHREGARAVMTMNLRLDRDAFLADPVRRNGNAALVPRELVSVAMRHLHPWTQSLMTDSASTSDNPTSVYWPVRSAGVLEGVLVRTLYLHPMLVDPVLRRRLPGGPIDSHYVKDCCPDVTACRVVDDSDALIVFELSPIGRAIGREISSHGVSPLRLAAAGSRCDGHHLSYWRHSIRIHAGDCDARWAGAQAASSRFARRFAYVQPWGSALLTAFEALKWLRRRHDAYQMAVRKTGRRCRHALRWVRTEAGSTARGLRKSIRPPVTTKQVARPVRLIWHRVGKACTLGLKRIRRRVPVLGR